MAECNKCPLLEEETDCPLSDEDCGCQKRRTEEEKTERGGEGKDSSR